MTPMPVAAAMGVMIINDSSGRHGYRQWRLVLMAVMTIVGGGCCCCWWCHLIPESQGTAAKGTTAAAAVAAVALAVYAWRRREIFFPT